MSIWSLLLLLQCFELLNRIHDFFCVLNMLPILMIYQIYTSFLLLHFIPTVKE